MRLSRQEINLRRLLARCELMCKHKKDDHFEKYIESLEDMLQEIRRQSETSIESIKGYQKRIMNIKSVSGITTSKYDEFVNPEVSREELLGLRQRNVAQPKNGDLDNAIKYYEDVQQNITTEMLSFATALKEQSELANKIIKKDTEVVGNSMQLTDQNLIKLTSESIKLSEHSKRAWKCWMWVMLFIVMVIFINMILFMKVMKKNK